MSALGNLIWIADHETGDITQWTNGGGNFLMTGSGGVVNVNTITTEQKKAGTYAIKTQITAGANQYASTQYFRYPSVNGPNTILDGMYCCHYYSTALLDYTTGPSWHNIMQWKAKFSDGFSHPVFTIGFLPQNGKGNGGSNYLQLRNTREHFLGQGASVDATEVTRVYIPIGSWFEIRTRYEQSNTATGRVRVWLGINDVFTLIYDVQNVITRPLKNLNNDDLTEMHWSVNNYGGGLNPATNTLYFDNAGMYYPPTGGVEANRPWKIKLNGTFQLLT